MTSILGRARELDVLSSVLQSTGTRVVLMSGEAGSGKTRLLAAAAELAHGRHVVQLRGFQPEASAPLVAAAPLLSTLAAVDARLELALGQEAPGAMVHLFEMTHRALQKVGEDTVLLVDDEQWLDPTTRALLHYLVRSAAMELGNLCLVSAARPCAARVDMHDSLHAVLGGENLTSLQVLPLDRESGMELVRRLDPTITDALAAQHWEKAGGSPFWLTLLAQAEGGPDGGLIRARVAACDAQARTLLELLSVAARPMDADLLPRLLASTPSAVLAATEELESRGLVLARFGTITVVHDLVRETVVADIDPGRARERHRVVAGWLAESEDPAVLLAALHHRAASAEPLADLACRILASPRRAWLGAHGVAELVELVLAGIPDPDPGLLVELAGAAEDVGEAGVALEVWSRVALGRGEESLRLRACVGAGRAAFESVDHEGARGWLARARAFDVPDLVDEVALEVLESDVLRWLEGRFDEAAACSRRALRLVEDSAGHRREEVRRATVEALGSLGDAAMVRGDVAAMNECAGRLDDLAGGDPELMHTAMLYRLTALNLQAEPRRALDLVLPHWAAAVDSGSPAKQLALGGYVVNLSAEVGDLDAAARSADRLRRLMERMTDRHRRLAIGTSVWFTRAAVLGLELLTGDWRRALDEIDATLDQMIPHNRLTWAAALAEQWSMFSSVDDAMVESLGRSALSLAEEVACPRCGEEARLVIARTRGRAGDLTGARALLDTWDRPEAPRSVHQRVLWTRALILAGDQKYDEARGLLDALEDELRIAGAELERMWLLLDRARALKGADLPAAVAAGEEAAARAHELGAVNVEAIARRELRALGARPWRRGVHVGEGLSERERQVAALVADGLSNPEIAERLFLSRKTVERHVSVALGKIGARNRTELARVWRDATPHDEGVP